MSQNGQFPTSDMGDAGVCGALLPVKVGVCRVTLRKCDIFSEEPAADGADFFESGQLLTSFSGGPSS